MSAESVSLTPGADTRTTRERLTTRLWAWLIVVTIGTTFVLLAGGNLDLGPVESRLGISADAGFGPFGQVFGGWEPGIWPATLAPSVLWAWGEGGTPTSASVRWPAAIAGLLAGLILVRRMMGTFGVRSSLILALCWFGSIALIDRSAGAGLDLIAGLATIGALDRLVGRGSDLRAGLWTAVAFLAGGWPPVALIMLTTIVIGRREAGLTLRLLAPPAAAAIAWIGWACSVAPAEACAAALALPLTQKSAWLMALGVLALGLPWSPFAALALSRPMRDSWPDAGRSVVIGWLQVAGACLLAGTVIPGLASAARMPAVAGLAIASAACCDRVLAQRVPAAVRSAFLALAATLVALWVSVAVVGGMQLAAAVPYYRSLSIVLVAMALPIAALGLKSVLVSDPRRAILAVALVALCLKLAHWGYYIPEWNYRRGQGPWGRAIGQWVPPHWPIYTTHTWGPDLAFATGRQFRQLGHPKLLDFQPRKHPHHVLLLEAEFEHWPKDAPRLVQVASFQDDRGQTRILARTEGEFSWRMARQIRDE